MNVDRPLSFDPFGPAPAAPSLSPRKIPLLLLACVCGQVDMLRTLLQRCVRSLVSIFIHVHLHLYLYLYVYVCCRGCDLLALDHDGSTCLHYIARAKGNNAEMVRELQQHPGSGPHAPPWQSALLNLQNSAGDSWLHVACDHKQVSTPSAAPDLTWPDRPLLLLLALHLRPPCASCCCRWRAAR